MILIKKINPESVKENFIKQVEGEKERGRKGVTMGVGRMENKNKKRGKVEMRKRIVVGGRERGKGKEGERGREACDQIFYFENIYIQCKHGTQKKID